MPVLGNSGRVGIEEGCHTIPLPQYHHQQNDQMPRNLSISLNRARSGARKGSFPGIYTPGTFQ